MLRRLKLDLKSLKSEVEPAGKGPSAALRPRAAPRGSLQAQLAVGVASSLQVAGGGDRVRTSSVKDVIEKRIA